MRLIKLLAISVVFFFLLLTAFTSLIPSTVRISRAVDILASREKVLPYLNQESNWNKWNRWVQDSSRQIEIKSVDLSDSILSYIWNYGDRSFSSNYALHEIKDGTTTVQWYFEFKLDWFPWEKLGSIVYDQQMGPIMEESLGNLKQLVEANP